MYIGRAANAAAASVQNVRVDHGRPNVLVAQQFLHCANVVAVGQVLLVNRLDIRASFDIRASSFVICTAVCLSSKGRNASRAPRLHTR
jgi:hypothetical protein